MRVSRIVLWLRQRVAARLLPTAAAASLLLLLLSRLRPGLEKSNGNFTIFPCSHTCACLVPGPGPECSIFFGLLHLSWFSTLAKMSARSSSVARGIGWLGRVGGVQAVRHLLLSFALSLCLPFSLSLVACFHSHTALTLRFAFEMVMGLHLNCAYVVQGVWGAQARRGWVLL